MDMTKDALDLLLSTAKKSAGAQMLDIKGDGRQAWYWADGELRDIELKPPVRAHQVASLADLANYAIRLSRDEVSHPVIWHCQKSVVLVCDDADRRDRVILPLEVSRQFRAIMEQDLEHGEPHWFQQREFVQFLRMKLGLDAATVGPFRKLDWKSCSETHGVVERSRESLGRSVEAQVAGAAELPDFLTVECPIYQTLGEDRLYRVQCLLEFDAQNARMTLTPPPGELQLHLDHHQQDVRNRLMATLGGEDANGIPIYYGTP